MQVTAGLAANRWHSSMQTVRYMDYMDGSHCHETRNGSPVVGQDIVSYVSLMLCVNTVDAARVHEALGLYNSEAG